MGRSRHTSFPDLGEIRGGLVPKQMKLGAWGGVEGAPDSKSLFSLENMR